MSSTINTEIGKSRASHWHRRSFQGPRALVNGGIHLLLRSRFARGCRHGVLPPPPRPPHLPTCLYHILHPGDGIRLMLRYVWAVNVTTSASCLEPGSMPTAIDWMERADGSWFR